MTRQSLEQIQNASLQHEALQDDWLKTRMPNGYGLVSAMCIKRKEDAEKISRLLKLFHGAIRSVGSQDRGLAYNAKFFRSRCVDYIHNHVSSRLAEMMKDLGAIAISINGEYEDGKLLLREERRMHE